MATSPNAQSERRAGVRLAGACLLALTLALGSATSHAQTPAAASVRGASSPASANKSSAWSELTPAQRAILAPLADEWDGFEPARRVKWLAIADKFPSMSPEKQARLQDRMREWAALTPEQRRLARESYARAKKLGEARKSEKWEQYQRLPEEQRLRLAEDAAARKKVATLPSPDQPRTLPPIKSANKSTTQSVAKPAPEPGSKPNETLSSQSIATSPSPGTQTPSEQQK